jgi:hypothetical protein
MFPSLHNTGPAIFNRIFWLHFALPGFLDSRARGNILQRLFFLIFPGMAIYWTMWGLFTFVTPHLVIEGTTVALLFGPRVITGLAVVIFWVLGLAMHNGYAWLNHISWTLESMMWAAVFLLGSSGSSVHRAHLVHPRRSFAPFSL